MEQLRIADTIARQLETMILEGVLKPGEKLPPERRLAAKLGVSRPSLREAIQKLAARRLLKTRRGGGTFVDDSLNSEFTNPLLEIFQQHPERRYDVLEVRHALEGLAAYQAALKSTEADKLIIRERYDELLQTHESRDAIAEAKADTEFHLAIAQAADNLVLMHIMRDLFTLLRESISFNLNSLYTKPGIYQLLKQQHHELLTAVVNGEPDRAKKAAQDHLVFVEQTLQNLAREEAREERALRRLSPFSSG